MIRYEFKEDEPLYIKNANDADPQIFGEALAKIKKDNDGLLKPEFVWRAAQSPSHPLHRHYDWDLQTAAESHWTDVSRRIIRIVMVVNPKAENGQSRAFFSIKDLDGTSYRNLKEVKKRIDLQETLLRNALRDLEAWAKRYDNIRDVCKMVAAAIDKLKEQMEDRRREEAERRRDAAAA